MLKPKSIIARALEGSVVLHKKSWATSIPCPCDFWFTKLKTFRTRSRNVQRLSSPEEGVDRGQVLITLQHLSLLFPAQTTLNYVEFTLSLTLFEVIGFVGRL